MTFLKNLTVSLCSFFLFLALTIFGIAFALKATALNPDFVTKELNNLQIAPLVKDYVQIQNPDEIPNLDEIVNQAVTDIEPAFKKQAGVAIHSVYDYLLGSKPNPELALTLRQTFLSSDFVTPLVDSLDIASLLTEPISRQLADSIPIVVPGLDTYVKDVLTSAEPSLKKQVVAVSGPVADYVLGLSHTLQAEISLVEINDSLKIKIRQLLVDSPPAELALIPAGLRASYFDQLYAEFAGLIPTSYPIDSSLIDSQMRTGVADGLASAEDGLKEARLYVNYFQTGYTWAIVFMAVMVLGIILIVRNVKDIAHRLGIPLVTYGVLEYGGVLVTKYLISSGKLNLEQVIPGLPASLEAWIIQLMKDSLRPVEIFSLAVLILGAALVVISFLYKPHKDLTWS